MRIREFLYLKVRAYSTRAAPRRREKKFTKLTIPPIFAFSLQFLVKARPDITCSEVVARLRLDLDVRPSPRPRTCAALHACFPLPPRPLWRGMVPSETPGHLFPVG